MSTIKTFGPVDERSLAQLERCMEAGGAEFGVLCADHHPGYSQPIGGGIAYEGYVSPSGVGYDICCGNKAVRTDLVREDLDTLGGVEAIMREVTSRISFGMAVPAQERTDHPVLDAIRASDFAPQRKLAQLAESQLGTVGSGNHYVNLMEDEDRRVWDAPGTCPIHERPLKKVRKLVQVKPGIVDWPAVQARLRKQGIVLVGGGADEAPEVYKRLPDVLAAHGETIRVKNTLRPLGVAMAGRDVYDPYKD